MQRAGSIRADECVGEFHKTDCIFLRSVCADCKSGVFCVSNYEIWKGLAGLRKSTVLNVMNEFVLTCCSTADLPKERFEQLKVSYVCFNYTIDGVTYPDDLGQSIPFDEFYRRMAEGAMTSTSQVNMDQYLQFFEPFLAEGKDVLHVTLSSGISGSFNSACAAAQVLREKYPERKLYIVDSLGASSACDG